MARAVALLFLIMAIVNISAAPEPRPICGDNEVFTSCSSSCPPTCQNPQPPVCTLACISGCECKPGFIRDENLLNRCVPTQRC